MIGTIRWNLVVGAISLLVTLLLSFSSNIVVTTLLRSAYSFIIVFVLMFAVRWVLGTVIGLNHIFGKEGIGQEEDESHKGAALDVVTPDDSASIHNLLKEQESGATASLDDQPFTPLNPPKLTTKRELDPEELAKALRQMSEE